MPKRLPNRDVVVDRLPEWKLQAAGAAELDRRIAEGQPFAYAASLEGVVGHLNAYQTQLATATGVKRGEPDLRLYFRNGRIAFVELKATDGKLTQSQKERIPILRGLGFIVHIVFALTESDMAALIGAIVDRELQWPGASHSMASASWWPKVRALRP